RNQNGDVVAARAENNGNGNNANQIRCYNYKGVVHYAKNYIIRPRKRDVAYLQTQLLIAQKKEVGTQLQTKTIYKVFRATGAAPGIKSIWNSTWRTGGRPASVVVAAKLLLIAHSVIQLFYLLVTRYCIGESIGPAVSYRDLLALPLSQLELLSRGWNGVEEDDFVGERSPFRGRKDFLRC
ncbi:hypothetical protein Tco_0713461, partial [Tanacetum coccineum]